MAKIIDTSSFDSEVLKSTEPVLLDFYADWCGPCKIIAPFIDEISDETAGKAKVVKLNVDDSKEVAMKYGVRSIPTLGFFKGGELVDQIIGVVPKDDIMTKLNSIM